MKLGEALIEARLITREQLMVALERQAVLGGRIDTNIVEMRFLNDERLTSFLGKFLRLPVVTADALNSIPDEVIRILKKEVVENYMLIPFALDRQRLHVAMLNPRNIKDIDNLRFTTGCEIIPYVITELRLLHALEKYYGIERETRYIGLKDRFDPDTDPEDVLERIEKISDEACTGGKSGGKGPGEKEKVSCPEPVEDRKGTGRGLMEALLINAIYTAKLFYLQQGSAPVGVSIEDEVLDNWKSVAEKLRKEQKDKPPR